MRKEVWMRVRKLLLSGCALLALSLSAVVHAQYNAGEAEGAGVIRELNFSSNKMNVAGSEYSVSPTVAVEINGSYGAFTMLQTGMKIEFVYLVYSDGEKVMTSIVEVPAVDEF
ncbi:MAG: hypothetical protein AAF513_12650 [Pseudomonadota bacterium]